MSIQDIVDHKTQNRLGVINTRKKKSYPFPQSSAPPRAEQPRYTCCCPYHAAGNCGTQLSTDGHRTFTGRPPCYAVISKERAVGGDKKLFASSGKSGGSGANQGGRRPPRPFPALSRSVVLIVRNAGG